MKCHEGAKMNSKYPNANPKDIVAISHLLPCLSAKYPPGNCTKAVAKDPTKNMTDNRNGVAPKLK